MTATILTRLIARMGRPGVTLDDVGRTALRLTDIYGKAAMLAAIRAQSKRPEGAKVPA